jgi:hypothetical protein
MLDQHARIQTTPESCSDEEIRSEIQYLIRLNRKYGTHPLRTETYLKLAMVLSKRQGSFYSA